MAVTALEAAAEGKFAAIKAALQREPAQVDMAGPGGVTPTCGSLNGGARASRDPRHEPHEEHLICSLSDTTSCRF